MNKHTNILPCLSCEDKLIEAHPFLRNWFKKTVRAQFPNAHIAWSYRGEEDQEECVKNKTSHLHWPKSAHNRRAVLNEADKYDLSNEDDPNTKPESIALDLFQLNDQGIAIWDPAFFLTLAKDIRYYGLPLFWGGDWPSLGDRDHFQYKLATH